MSWGKWRQSFFAAGAAHCRFEGWKSWFRCTGAGLREIHTFASQFHWDLQFQSGALEVLNRAVRLGFALQSVCSEVPFCEKFRVKRSFWKLGLSLLVEVSCKTLILEAWIVTFVSRKTLILEAWIVTFSGSLVENARFGSLNGHFWFWKLGWSLWVKSRGVQQECQARVSRKSVEVECLGKSVKKECQAKASSKIV